MEKKFINSVCEICNNLDKDHSLLIYGDFNLTDFVNAVKKYKISKFPIGIQIIDCTVKNPSEFLSNAIITGNLTEQTTIYVLDNVDMISSKEAKEIASCKQTIMDSDKYLILIASNLQKLDMSLGCFQKIKLGIVYEDNASIQNLVNDIFTKINRKAVIEELKESDYPLHYILTLMAYNLPFFFDSKTKDFHYNSQIIALSSIAVYKTGEDNLISYICYTLFLAKSKKVIRFPPKENSK